MKNKSVLLIGGGGFIGSHIASMLSYENDVTVYDTFGRDALRFQSRKNSITAIEGNALDAGTLNYWLKDDGYDYIIHLVSICGVDTVIQNPIETLETNFFALSNTLKIVKSLKNLKKIVVFSSGEVYGTVFGAKETEFMKVEPPNNPRWSYAASKIALEHLAYNYSIEYNLPTVIIRPFNIYGPGQVGLGTIRNFIRQAILDEDMIVHGDGSQIRAWCYISDIAECVIESLSIDNQFEIFNIGNHKETITIHNLALLIKDLTNSNSKIKFVDNPYKNYVDITLRVPNIEKASKLLGYQPKITLIEGLKKSIDWNRAQI